jgi:hypothetical protein
MAMRPGWRVEAGLIPVAIGLPLAAASWSRSCRRPTQAR